MEGCDANTDGSPGDLTVRRYLRYAAGGSGVIWFEAVSVMPEGRSNPHQLMLTPKNADNFKILTERIRHRAREAFGPGFNPLLLLQITHSGRFSKPDGRPRGKAAWYNPHLGGAVKIFSDEELDRLSGELVHAATLAKQAGFDGVDIKACHGYLLHELLGAHIREGKYGGSFDNRVRLLSNVVRDAAQNDPNLLVAVRLSATDGIPFPYGFGMIPDGSRRISLDEPRILIQRLIDDGCRLLNVSAGVPTHSPHIVRPFDKPIRGAAASPEPPLKGVARLISLTAELQRSFPVLPMVGSGYSWLRNLWPYVAAGAIEQGKAALVGLGRGSFAYPDAPRDLMEKGELNHHKSCVACSLCSELMRAGRNTGCVVRDADIYGEEYMKMRGFR